jgi:hypothetical protein
MTRGARLARTFRDDVENVRDALDAKIASGAMNWKTARNAWATFTKLCSCGRGVRSPLPASAPLEGVTADPSTPRAAGSAQGWTG